MDFDYCEEYLIEYIKQNIIIAGLKKSTFSFSSDLKIDKKINDVKEDAKRKSKNSFKL